ncbi:MAG TPA: beta-galactosidase [Dongiaceae bacterium]|nr:beta-galactosidase [Dongiaceae bacterium]
MASGVLENTRIALVGLLLGLVLIIAPRTRANDGIFAPQSAAQNAINFDGRGFLINGQRVFIVSAGIEYARVPHELWADRLLRFKRAGFNCIEIYTFWNFHEPQSGQFDFSGDRDLGAFLELAQSLGLYAIVRVGPYSCAEWDSGGYPVWLRSVPNLEVRVNNAAFKQYVTRFWSHLMPIVASHQINHGGNVILVQLENEHGSGWGTDGLGDAYFQYLQSTALADGLEVPYFFSGLHHDHDPAGSSPWSSSGRSNPWFSTEFWCDWFDQYGETAADAQAKDWATWKILAYGGNGYNYYMAHGGTDFDYFNNDEDAASYDYGAAVGQTGDLRPEYYKFKRAAWFARSFQEILENSDNSTSIYANAAINPAIAVTARTAPAGTIVFLANAGTTVQTTQVRVGGISYPQTGMIQIGPSEIMPVVTGFPLLPGVTLKVAPTRVLGLTQQADTTTLVIYGAAGLPAELYFNVPAGTMISGGESGLTLNGTNLTLQTAYPANGVAEYSFATDSGRVRILVLSDVMADNTWFVDAARQNFVICGLQYVGAATLTNGSLQVVTEKPWQNPANLPVSVYGPGETPITLSAISTPGPHPGTLLLTPWQVRSDIDPAAPGYNTTGWLASTSGPQQMGADGDVSCYAWYRAAFNVPAAGTYTVAVGNVADHMQPFVDGTAVSAASTAGNSFSATLSAGDHVVAVFTSHYGRNKLVGYTGPISRLYAKGLTGQAHLFGVPVSGPTTLTGWKMMATTSVAVGQSPPAPSASGWSNYTVGNDAFGGQSGYAWFQTPLPAIASAGAELASFGSVDDNGWVYLNGTMVASNTGWNVPFDADLSSAWISGGTNVLSVLVQNTGNIGGLDSAVKFTTYQTGMQLTNWTQHGGPGDPNATTGWQALAGQLATGPCFFKTTFTAAPPDGPDTSPMWRVKTTGLSHGSVWVNGHNLGRYPETIPAPGLYLPECWLESGKNANTLIIYDEAGNAPSQVQVQPETAASRDAVEYQSAQPVSLAAPLPAPLGLAASISGSQASLFWNAVPGAVTYHVKRATRTGGETTVGAIAGTNYTDTGLANDTTYYYTVSAVDAETESVNSEEVAVTTRENLASKRPATTDSQQPGNVASNGDDGDTGTRWCANDSNLNHWWQVDLGGIYDLTGDEVNWERNASYGYTVTVSTNNSTWTTMVNRNGGPAAQVQTDAFVARARYVRITVKSLTGGNWASFYEFQVFGLDATNTTLADGCFRLRNRNSGLLLHAAGGGVTNGTAIEQAADNGGAGQVWALTNAGGGQYELVQLQSGLALSSPADSTNAGALLELASASGGNGQKWNPVPVAGGYYQVLNAGSGLSLHVLADSAAAGACIEQQTDFGPASQWTLEPVAHLPLVSAQTLPGQITLLANLFQGQTCVLETSTNLTQWWPAMTNTLTAAGEMNWSNSVSGNTACQFYRVRFQQ